MKHFFAFFYLFCTIVFLSGCRKDPMPFPQDSPWIGLWESQTDALEIWQNGTGEWVTNKPRRERKRKKTTPLEFKQKYRNFHGLVSIEDGKLKLGNYEGNKFNQIFTIDRAPTDGIDDQGNSYTYIILDGEVLKKTY